MKSVLTTSTLALTPALPLALSLALLAVACSSQLEPRQGFERDVVPVLEARCANSQCHGVAAGAEPELTIDWTRMMFHLDADGRLADLDEAYDTTRRYIVTDEDPAFSSLLLRPLPAAYGGMAHFGGACFASPEDTQWLALYDWIALESGAEPGGGENTAPLDQREQLFADTVQPHLVARGCYTSNCHGLSAALPYRFDGGVRGDFSRAATRTNYTAALSMLSLDGDSSQSRLLRKGLSLQNGGIVHKGGNNAFFTGDDDLAVQAVLDWACAERGARLEAPCEPVADGFVYVRGPVQAQDFFDLDAWVPGSDLWWSHADGTRENLTESLHDAPADVREPALDPTGTRLAFSMRQADDAGHHLWILDLSTRQAVQVTDEAVGADRDPTWSPDGALWFVSTRAGILSDDGQRVDAELYSLELDTGLSSSLSATTVTRRSWSPQIERKPVFFAVGMENSGQVGFTALRQAIASKQRAHIFRFPPGLKTEYHPHFGITAPENLFSDMRELPDGRYSVILGDLDNVWEGGRLALVERNFGPEIPDDLKDEPSIPFYADPIARLDPDATASGLTGSLYRDPSALYDGRILVARAPGPLDLSDPDAQPHFQIEALTVSESASAPSGTQTTSITDRELLLEDDELSLTDPEPVYVRKPAPLDTEQHWDPDASTGLVRVIGLGTIASMLLDLPPSGVKPVAYGVTGVRLVEALPLEPQERQPIPSTELLYGAEGATTTGIGSFPPARVLAELPLFSDGSVQGLVPAGVSFRIQPLDADGRVIDLDYNRWYYVAPGQTLTQGVSATDDHYYTFACAVCHGALDGQAEDVFVEPDIMSTASISLSQYLDRDPRRPIAPPEAGDATRIEVDWSLDVLPIVVDSCGTSGCHQGPTAAAGLDLSDTPTTWFDQAYENLLAGPVVPGSSTQSPLVELLVDQAHGDLSDDEIHTITRWIELGATWRGTP